MTPNQLVFLLTWLLATILSWIVAIKKGVHVAPLMLLYAPATASIIVIFGVLGSLISGAFGKPTSPEELIKYLWQAVFKQFFAFVVLFVLTIGTPFLVIFIH